MCLGHASLSSSQPVTGSLPSVFLKQQTTPDAEKGSMSPGAGAALIWLIQHLPQLWLDMSRLV